MIDFFKKLNVRQYQFFVEEAMCVCIKSDRLGARDYTLMEACTFNQYLDLQMWIVSTYHITLIFPCLSIVGPPIINELQKPVRAETVSRISWRYGTILFTAL